MKRAVAVLVIGLAFLAGTQTHVYNASNAGIVFGPEQAHVGLEVKGFPGLFVGIGNQQWSVYLTGGRIEVQS